MWPTLGLSLGSPIFCSVTWSVGALCWVAFLGIVVGTILLPVTVYIFILDPLYGPPWVFTPDQGFPEVLQLLNEKLWSIANYFCHIGEGIYDTVLSREYDGYPTVSTGQCGWA